MLQVNPTRIKTSYLRPIELHAQTFVNQLCDVMFPVPVPRPGVYNLLFICQIRVYNLQESVLPFSRNLNSNMNEENEEMTIKKMLDV